jgi:hypothetical protein
MKKAKSRLVQKYHNACLDIAKEFWNKYYNEESQKDFQKIMDQGYFFQ